jgi:altronate dehydratase
MLNFQDIGRIPSPGDNVAIATKNLDAGTQFVLGEQKITLSHAILEGHRFAIEPISGGERLYSWSLPFGVAQRRILPGEYVCNSGMLQALELRNLRFALPDAANFQDYRQTVDLDERNFHAGTQVELYGEQGTFAGYSRSGGRGVGTRNYIVILGTTSLTASFAKALENRVAAEADKYENIDGITAVTHTEGGDSHRPNNLDLVLRTLAGFTVHPNVGAVLAVDFGTEVLSNEMLQEYLRTGGYPIDDVPHRFYSIKKNFAAALDDAEAIVRDWLDPVNDVERTQQPLTGLRIALQCGGSDAFSGVSGNPLAGWTAREVIKHGGSAALAETDELIGAEPYILANTKDIETARRFLEKISRFKERIAWHGHSAEGNPTGGNKLRGLYNIALKSIGAARKKDPDVRLDHVIDYAQPMTGPGFYFMDSPGNDLESIAGQVASGCNMIYFITGNGSITNFPFVPTVKYITTTGRWNLLSEDMDVNAGRYQDGMPLEELGKETFNYTVDIASGMRSVGERAGHSQVSIWRDWRQTDDSRLHDLQNQPDPDGIPIRIAAANGRDACFDALPSTRGPVCDQVGLIVPTSLCAGQIALRIAARLNAGGGLPGVSRFVALPHTEGCGTSSGDNEALYTRTLIGHLLHPFVREALLLEHGCEKTHNDLIRHVLEQHGIDPGRFGYASIQLDGGIDSVVNKVEGWFSKKLGGGPAGERRKAGLEALSLGLLAVRRTEPTTSESLAGVVSDIVGSKGTVVIPQNTSLLESPAFLEALGLRESPPPSLGYGAVADQAGLHVMATPTGHIVETLTGLGGSGVQTMLAHVSDTPIQGHPLVPVLQVTTGAAAEQDFYKDMDFVIPASARDVATISDALMRLLCDTASQTYQPRLWAAGNTDFQFTRGMLGVSL